MELVDRPSCGVRASGVLVSHKRRRCCSPRWLQVGRVTAGRPWSKRARPWGTRLPGRGKPMAATAAAMGRGGPTAKASYRQARPNGGPGVRRGPVLYGADSRSAPRGPASSCRSSMYEPPVVELYAMKDPPYQTPSSRTGTEPRSSPNRSRKMGDHLDR